MADTAPVLKQMPPEFAAAELLARYREVRQRSMALAAPLSAEDAQVQTMADVSPTKWHLAHTTWFFETFVLRAFDPGFSTFAEGWHFLFNSYYEAEGPRHARPARGQLSRPSLDDVCAYRRDVDSRMADLIASQSEGRISGELFNLVTLGCHHEEQHQELILTDIKHVLAANPLLPAYTEAGLSGEGQGPDEWSLQNPWVSFSGGVLPMGYDGTGFHFDHEGPHHEILVPDFKLAKRLVTNGDILKFIKDGGYRQPALWLSDGWDRVQEEGWTAPLYWFERDGTWWQQTLHGPKPIRTDEPVCHLSYFEADAFASWADARLPTEAEWETACRHFELQDTPPDASNVCFHPAPARKADGLAQMFGAVWQWTSSAFGAYPGFRPAAGAVGEYNGKFMNGQYVLRGSSCATPPGHSRPTYRNFFPPQARWQFTGLRLASDS